MLPMCVRTVLSVVFVEISIRCDHTTSGEETSSLMPNSERPICHIFHFLGHATAKWKSSSMSLEHIIHCSVPNFSGFQLESLFLVPIDSCNNLHHGVNAPCGIGIRQKKVHCAVVRRHPAGIFIGGRGGDLIHSFSGCQCIRRSRIVVLITLISFEIESTDQCSQGGILSVGISIVKLSSLK